jgi:hypothetical protein
MFTHVRVRPAGIGLWDVASARVCLRTIGVMLLGLALGGCSVAASQGTATEAANPQARVPLTTYRPVTSGYQRQQPVEPLPWRERNERVTPQEKPGGRP